MPDLLLDTNADDQKLLAQVVTYYQLTLLDTKEGLDYLRKRGITSQQAIDTFRIGYANRTLGKLLPSRDSNAGKELRHRLEALGIFRPATGHEHFSGCVVFPVLHQAGAVVDIYGRKTLGVKLRKGTPLHMYLGQQRHGVWNAQGITKELVVLPSLWDALTLWVHGYENVTTSFGHALSDHLLTVLREHQVERVLTSSEPLAEALRQAGFQCFLLKLPLGMDVNSYAVQVANPAQALNAVLRKAEWLDTKPVEVTPIIAAPVETPARQEPVPLVVASPLPPAPQDVQAVVSNDEVSITLGDRRYRVRGLGKNPSFDLLKINLLVSNDAGMFVDTFDLYSAKHRRSFVVQAAAELAVEEQVVKKDLGRVLLKLEELQEQKIETEVAPPKPTMTDQERAAALELLRDPNLLDRVVQDFTVVGERANKLVGYLAAVSRKLDEPLAVVIQSTSAAGKTALMDAVLAFVPPEDLVKFSAMTGQSLYYMGDGNLKHKILAIVEEEGAQRASYALKLLQSEGELRIASTGKDAGSGRLVTQEYRVEGPVMLFLTTTSSNVDEELLNRCLVLSVDEGAEQTRAIHQAQRRKQTLQGMLASQDRQHVVALHQNAQRLLRPLLVVNPFAESLTFQDAQTRTRRDHAKYLTLIRAIALLHQHQRAIKTVIHQGREVEYIEVTEHDIAIANELSADLLGRCLDELPPQTRLLLQLITQMVDEACRRKGVDRCDYHFTRRQVREHSNWSHTQLKLHLRRLVELEYLVVHKGKQGLHTYELVPSTTTDRSAKNSFWSGLVRDWSASRNGHKPLSFTT